MESANEKFLKYMKEKNRIKALEADFAFHTQYVSLTENKELEKIISNLKTKLKRLDLYYFDKIHSASLSYGEHKAIIHALKPKRFRRLLLKRLK